MTEELRRELLSGAAPLNRLFEIPPDQVARMAQLAHDLWRQGRRDQAESIFRGLIALDDRIPYGHAGMGIVALAAGDLDAAERSLRRAVELDPADPAIAVNLGEVLVRQGNVEASIAVLERVASAGTPAHANAVRRARAMLVALLPSEGRGSL